MKKIVLACTLALVGTLMPASLPAAVATPATHDDAPCDHSIATTVTDMARQFPGGIKHYKPKLQIRLDASEALGVCGGPLYVYGRLKFHGPEITNNTCQGVPCAKRISIQSIALFQDSGWPTNPRTVCDQDSHGGSDGGGCINGTYSSNGPCNGYKRIDSHNLAMGADGCVSDSVTYSQSDKAGELTWYTEYDWVVQASYNVEWVDGSTSGGQFTVACTNCSSESPVA